MDARQQAAAQAQSIADMVAALTLDYDMLEELREELADLERIADGCADADEARDRIMEDPLSIETRSGWVSVGEEMSPEEYRIALCTGGPHVEIVAYAQRLLG